MTRDLELAVALSVMVACCQDLFPGAGAAPVHFNRDCSAFTFRYRRRTFTVREAPRGLEMVAATKSQVIATVQNTEDALAFNARAVVDAYINRLAMHRCT